MPRVQLLSGPYQSRSVISSAQRSTNLFPEKNGDPQSPTAVTHYPTPGLSSYAAPPIYAGARGMYTASNGDLYVVLGNQLFSIASDATMTLVGTVADRTTPVSMADNGLALVLVDGSSQGYAVDLDTQAFSRIQDPNFLGADRVAYLDTYFCFNQPGTNKFFISLSNASFAMLSTATAGSAFDSLDLAAKTGSPDNILALIAVHSQIWLIGALSTEIWYNSGASDFTFERQPGAFIEHGCVAPYSVAKQDVSVFWLSRDREGQGLVIQGSGYDVQRISTHAIEADIQSYKRVDDAVGFCYQQEGHAFYVLTFPTADKTWAYELKTGQWHELAWTDNSGSLHRHRAGFCAFAYGKNLVLDWQNGTVMQLDPQAFTDMGAPIVRIRTLPHVISDGRRVSCNRLVIDLQTGTMSSVYNQQTIREDFDASFSFDFGRITRGAQSRIFVRWSDDRGATFGNAISQDIGGAGDYARSLVFHRLGMSRDRVFEISWSSPLPTALNGAFLDTTVHGS